MVRGLGDHVGRPTLGEFFALRWRISSVYLCPCDDKLYPGRSFNASTDICLPR